MDVGQKARHRRGRFSRWIPFRAGALIVLGCALAALLAGSAGAVDPTFTQATGSPIATGSGAIAVAAADLNGDGRRDLAVSNQGPNNISILLGNGTGGFSNASGSPVPVGSNPVSVSVADLNGDTRPDLAVSNENVPNPPALPGPGSVSILLGNGAGGFSNASGSPITVGTAPQSIAVSRLNGDAIPDLAVVNELTEDISILLGNGTGGFSAPTSVPLAAGAAPQSVVAADFDGDGDTDLATANEGLNNVTILLGNGLGGFPSSSTVPADLGPADIQTADLNGDTKADLVVANAGSDNVSILLGTGTGSFSNGSGSPVGVGVFPEGSTAADFNLDGKLDLAVANTGAGPPGNLTILLGTGTGSFSAAASTVPAGTEPTTLAAGDLNGDTKPDLAVANYGSGNVTVQLNTTTPPPTAVRLTRFVARATPKGIELRWRTAQESALLGFDVYRAGVKLNRALILARGSGTAGAAYRLLDRSARVGTAVAYRLQAVRADGTRAWIGRATATR